MSDWELLSGYVDGQVSGDERATLEDRLRTDANFREMLRQLESQKARCRSLSSSLSTEELVPEVSWKRCVGRLNEIDSARRAEGFISRYAWAFCSALIFIIVVAGGWQRLSGQSGDGQYVAQVMAGFVPQNRQTSNPESVRRWVEGVFDFAGDVTREDRLAVRGSEFGVFDGRRVERHFLEDKDGSFVLVAVEGKVPFDGLRSAAGDEKFYVGQMGAATCLAWHKPDHTIFLIGERPVDSLKNSARLLCRPE